MRSTMKLYLLLPLLVSFLTMQAWAAPDYVTAWPKQVLVEKPDPVLGDKSFWEHWVYSEDFAKRFKGFPVEKADPELQDGIKAMALRIFKRNFWQELNPRYPEQYACEIDVYFDSSIALPLSESGRPRRIFPAYPAGISASFKRLDPVAEKDAKAIQASQPAPSNMKTQPLIFAAPFDGRYSQFGVREYRPSLIPGMSVITLLSGLECKITAPLQNAGAHWLSLLGERHWDKTEGGQPKALYGSYTPPSTSYVFDPDSSPKSKGYFRVPEVFNQMALPKVTLVKVMNWCIHKKDAHANPVGKPMPAESWEPIAIRCEEAERRGKILPDPQYYPDKEGLQDTGY